MNSIKSVKIIQHSVESKYKTGFHITVGTPDSAGKRSARACTVDMQQTLQIVFPLTICTVSSIPDTAGVMIGTCTVDM